LGAMKNIIALLAAASCILFGVSCSSTDLSGSLPIPFTNPATNVEANVEVRPMPPKICLGLDVIPRPAPAE